MFETERWLLIIITLEQQVESRTVPEKLQSMLTLDMGFWGLFMWAGKDSLERGNIVWGLGTLSKMAKCQVNQ